MFLKGIIVERRWRKAKGAKVNYHYASQLQAFVAITRAFIVFICWRYLLHAPFSETYWGGVFFNFKRTN